MTIDNWTGFDIPASSLDEAADWIARLDSDSVSPQDQYVFMCWLEKSYSNRRAYEELSLSWAKFSLLKSSEHLIDVPQVLQFPILDGAKTMAWHNREATWWARVDFRTPIIVLAGLIVSILATPLPTSPEIQDPMVKSSSQNHSITEIADLAVKFDKSNNIQSLGFSALD